MDIAGSAASSKGFNKRPVPWDTRTLSNDRWAATLPGSCDIISRYIVSAASYFSCDSRLSATARLSVVSLRHYAADYVVIVVIAVIILS